jgi:hypothetical protein
MSFARRQVILAISIYTHMVDGVKDSLCFTNVIKINS